MREIWLESIREIGKRTGQILGNFVTFVFILLVGWIIARIAKSIVTKLLQLAKVDKLAERGGIDEILKKGDVRTPLSSLLGNLVYWILIIIVVVLGINALGFPMPADLVSRLALFIPRLIIALLVFVFGIFCATVLSGIVKASASTIGIKQAESLARLTRVGVIIFVAVIALQQIGITPTFLAVTFNIFFGAICFGFALALGLGAKDIVGDWIKKLVSKNKEGQ